MNGPTRAGGAGRNARCGAIRNRGDFLDYVVGIRRQGCEFVAQSHVHGKIWTEAPIVLNVPGEEALSNGNFVGASGSECIEPVRSVGQEYAKAAGSECGTRTAFRFAVIVHSPVGA